MNKAGINKLKNKGWEWYFVSFMIKWTFSPFWNLPSYGLEGGVRGIFVLINQCVYFDTNVLFIYMLCVC